MKNILTLFTLISTLSFAQKESDFYKDTSSQVSKTVNLVTDYKADGTDTKDDSAQLQKAIDDLTQLKNGGKIIIPEGTFYFSNIEMKSGVHLVVNHKVTISPTTPKGFIFHFGLKSGISAGKTIENVSIRGEGGRFTVDYSMAPNGRKHKMAFATFKNVNNFMIGDFNVLDNNTALSCLTFNSSSYEGNYFRATNGIVRNAHVTNASYGYGLIQAQTGKNILFKNISGEGGITLRLETGAALTVPMHINLDNIYGRNISIKNGHSATAMGSHTRTNGHVDIDGVRAESSLFASMVGIGFANKEQAKLGYTAGRFAPTSTIKNVHAIYGTQAQHKPKNVRQLPCELRTFMSTTLNPDGASYKGPSIAAIKNSDPKITIEDVTYEGFLPSQKIKVNKEFQITCEGNDWKPEKEVKYHDNKKKNKKKKH
ncbi:glycosyl hydrolase family 28-related protein [Flavivirga amylovorans]|uniref:Glycosyl hydrolase family 28-related protein n=1 Tax=Flavivirga amylovorans TaxID=870486 RepID=A0ABT8WXR4_9FLAO|nr:glycosyl hydrolase family 28-related protein [Flavivirga amylovorans]MDO5986184.1 glycosyl hydrolase family 28-related protein [Flavivirga amylovorans]